MGRRRGGGGAAAAAVVMTSFECMASGSGKTTLLNALFGKYHIDQGDVYVGGAPITRNMRKMMAYVLQEDIMYASLTLQETLWVR